jgi:hypothetical protein
MTAPIGSLGQGWADSRPTNRPTPTRAIASVAEPNRSTRNRGRRWAEPTINRGIVVLTVAAWQAFVEDLAGGILETIQRGVAGQPNLTAQFQLVAAATRNAIHRMNTPNVFNVRALFANVGFDPGASRAWRSGRWTITTATTSSRIDDWLKVRHAIAHGDDLPPVPVLARTDSGTPTLRRINAEACMALFEQVAQRTCAAANQQFP